ncbi:hypothetical protein BH18ACT3_BH18ACT3_06450 [soil metagenome]
MTQYLLAVHHSEDDETPSPDDTQKAYRQVDEFNKDLEASGAWVFAGGLTRRAARRSFAVRAATCSRRTVRSPRRRNSSVGSGSSRWPTSTLPFRGGDATMADVRPAAEPRRMDHDDSP